MQCARNNLPSEDPSMFLEKGINDGHLPDATNSPSERTNLQMDENGRKCKYSDKFQGYAATPPIL